MVPSSTRPIRARSVEEKQVRRADILRAAEELWTRTPYADLSMNQVAREVQLAKGTLYLYFETREELFLALLESHYQRWAEHTAQLCTQQPPVTPADTARLLAQSLSDSGGLRRLKLLAGQVLCPSKSVPTAEDPALRFRQHQLQILQQVAALLPYPPAVALRMVQHAEALCIGWQYLNEKAPSPEMLARYPQLAPMQLEIGQQLELALRAVITELAQEA